MATNRRQEFVFVHIPKTAGTSIRALLAECFRPEDVSPAFRVQPIDAEVAQHLAAFAVISGHISWADIAEHFPTRRLITFLRDPIDRCLSVYGYFRERTDRPLIPLDQIQGLNSGEEAVALARQLDPDDFFCSNHPHVLQSIDNRMVWQLGHHARYENRHQVPPAEALARAITNLKAFSFVGFYERLNEETSRLPATLGAVGQHSLPVLNPTLRPLHRTDISPRVLTALQRRTELDRRLYDIAREARFRLP
jgi:hypothetical protein